MSNKYDDIINLPRPESKYPRMPRANRAAQFSPFAALTGHEEAIRETAYGRSALQPRGTDRSWGRAMSSICFCCEEFSKADDVDFGKESFLGN